MSNVGKKIKTAGNNIIKSNTNLPSKRQPSNNAKNSNNNKNNNTNINKKKKPITPSINQRERNIMLVQGPNAMPGNGLWCQMPKQKELIEDKPYESIIPKIKAEAELLLDPEKAADKKLIAELKNQIKDLNLKLQDINLKYSDAEFRAQRAENLQKIAAAELQNKKDEYNIKKILKINF